jgi:hypothetical protein
MKISKYVTVVPVKGDMVIGTNVNNNNITKNFKILDISGLADLDSVLLAGNEATNNMFLTGNLSITGNSKFDGSNQFGPNGTTDFGHLVEFDNINLEGTVRDGASSVGTAGQVLSSTGSQVQWVDASAPIPTLNEVLIAGNTATNDLTLSTKNSDLIAEGGQVFGIATVPISVSVFNTTLDLNFGILDGADSYGTVGQVLSSNGGSAPTWITSPSYVLNMTATTAIGQTPTALDTALQLKFGSAQVNSSVSVDANGLITFIAAGNYRLNVNCCFLRNAISGYSNTQFGIFYNSAGGAPTVAASPIKSFTSDERQRPYMYNEDLVIKVVANSTLVVKMLNDTSLTSDNSTNLASYVGTLGTTPSASVLIYKSE